MPGARGGSPTAEGVRDGEVIGHRPVAHRRGGQQIGETAVERHRRHDGDAGLGIAGEGVGHDLEFGGDVQIGDTGADRGLDHRPGRGRERPGTVDHRVGVPERQVQVGGTTAGDRRHAPPP